MKISFAEDMRRIDASVAETYGLPALALMENAGRRTAEEAAAMIGGAEDRVFVVFAGGGNNGGDAFAAARHLMNMGARVKLFFTGEAERLGAAARAMHDALRAMGVEIRLLVSDRDWDRLRVSLRFADAIVDGVLGTGAHGELRKPVLRLVEEINTAGKPVMAIDIPSGVEADTGRVASLAVHANRTLALGLPKVGHLLGQGANATGELLVDDIGIPHDLLAGEELRQSLITRESAAKLLPMRRRDVHKGSCGRILVLAGSLGMTGAAALAAEAALRIGAGVVTLGVPEKLYPVLAAKLTEVMVVPVPDEGTGCFGGVKSLETALALAENADAVLIGPGIGRTVQTGEFVRLFAADVKAPLVMDADAIAAFQNHLDALRDLPQVPILTPHLGEFARLLGKDVEAVQEDLLHTARDAAREHQAVFALKSACTIVVYPDGDAFFTTVGNAGMATAGAGDVLAGTIVGLMRQMESGMTPIVGVYAHGRAGDLAYAQNGNGLVAGDILKLLPEALKELG